MPFTGVLMQPHKQLLIAVFNVYKAKNSSKYFWMEHWISFLGGSTAAGVISLASEPLRPS